MLNYLLRALAIGIRFILLLLLLFLVFKLLRMLFSSEPRRQLEGTTVRDPVCGMHVATELAVRDRIKGVDWFFCSIECRDKFRGHRS